MVNGNNNGLAIQTYDKQFAGLMPTIYGAKAIFSEVFGQLQALDGITNNKTAFSLKVNDVPVVVGQYLTDANIGFGSGTANSSRFGDRQEIIYQDVDVNYEGTWAFHEGLDKATVNGDLTTAVAQRLELQSQALTRKFNKAHGNYLVKHAAADLGDITDIVSLFNSASDRYVQLEVDANIVAYVSTDVYNAIVDLPATTTAKQSTVNIDTNGLVRYKGFLIKETPDAYLAGAEVIFAPENIGRAFTGIVTARAIDSEDFDGKALQGQGKYGQWISDDNLRAVFTAGVDAASGPVPVDSLALSQKTATLTVGGTKTITATITPDNATTKALTWSSSDESVATVADGVVTAVAAGNTNITATTTDGSNLTQSVAVTVNAA